MATTKTASAKTVKTPVASAVNEQLNANAQVTDVTEEHSLMKEFMSFAMRGMMPQDNDTPAVSIKRRLLGFVLGVVAFAGLMYVAFPLITALTAMIIGATGFAFLAYIVAVFAFILAFWLAGKAHNIVSNIVTGGLVENAATNVWARVKLLTAPAPVLA